MGKKLFKAIIQLYAGILYRLAPLCKAFSGMTGKGQRASHPKQAILLISRLQDFDLMIGLHEKALTRNDVRISFWVTQECVKKFPEILDRLEASKDIVGQIVRLEGLWRILGKLLTTDAFLSTVERTVSRHKLPYIITRLANIVGVSTYTLQHGFETTGLTYAETVYGHDVKFAAKTVLTWGQVKELPDWVVKETRDKAVAVGYPLRIESRDDLALSLPVDKRPIVGVFENLHWQRYSKSYLESFFSHLEKVARQRSNIRFVLKSHPVSIRKRSSDLAARLNRMVNVDLAESISEVELPATTPWLLSHALGIITTPSTIALDGAFSGIPVAVSAYGLNLDYYSPLATLQDLGDWQRFLDCLSEPSGYQKLKMNGERFLDRVLVPGDAPARILDLMTAPDISDRQKDNGQPRGKCLSSKKLKP